MAVRCLFAVFPLVCVALRAGRGGPGAKADVMAVGEGDVFGISQAGDAPRGHDPPGSVGALLGQTSLHDSFDWLGDNMNAGPSGYVRSGPWSVSMARDGSAGQAWDVTIGSNAFRISIQDGAGTYGYGISDAMALLGRVPPSIRRAYEIVSEPGHDGVGIYTSLDGACGHAGEHYINLAARCGAWAAAHEAGHVLEQRVRLNFEPALLDQFGEAARRDGISISDYGDTNTWEGFAEFAKYYAYALSGGSSYLRDMRNKSPNRFGLFEHALSRAGGGAPTFPMCWCRNPNQGTANYNGFSCNDGSTGWCEAHQTCYDDGWWNQGEYPCRSESVSQCWWRQTGNCDPYGPREPHLDQGCGAQMPTGSSGFCDCNGNDYLDSNEYGYGCSSSPGSCDSVCR